jgi:hypothetical protein
VKRIVAVATAFSLVAAPAAALGFGIGPSADEWIRAHSQRAEAIRRQQEPWSLQRQTPIEEVLGTEDWRRAPAESSAQAAPLLDVRVATGVEQILDGRFDPTAID